jgi:hypothetical protein
VILPKCTKSDYIIRKYNLSSGTCMPAAEQYVVDENGNKVAVILPSGSTST